MGGFLLHQVRYVRETQRMWVLVVGVSQAVIIKALVTN